MNKRVLVLGCLVLLSTVLVAETAIAQAGRSYIVDVTDNDGGFFQDCFTFNEDGTLVLALLFDPLTWARLNLDSKKNSFQASATTGNADGIALSFSGKPKNKSLKGDGINPDEGRTFKLKGKKTASCDDFRLSGPNPWLRYSR